MVLVYTLAWLPMLFIAVANGVARDLGYKKYTTELRAHQISTLTAAILFAFFTLALGRRWPLESATQALWVGGIWFLLTVAFEVIFGRYVAKHPWSQLAADYDLRRGRVWPLLLLWLFVLPCLCQGLSS
jgi:hypothetical protein